MRDHIRIGTRKSALALWQAEHISAELQTSVSKHYGRVSSL